MLASVARRVGRLLAGEAKPLTCFELESPAELRRIAATLLDQARHNGAGPAWIEATVPHSAPGFAAWHAAWYGALEGLNQQRNPLRRAFHDALLIVAAPWVVPLFRDAAADLWSVRTQVVRIEPEHDPATRLSHPMDHASIRAPEVPMADAPDPVLALREAERLHGMPDRIRDRATLLMRAGAGLHARNDLPAAEAILRTAVELLATTGDVVTQGEAAHDLADAILDQGRASEAEEAFRHALALAEVGGDTAVSRSLTIDMLGGAILDQGRAAEAEDEFRRALVLAEEGGGADGILSMIRQRLAAAKASQAKVP